MTMKNEAPLNHILKYEKLLNFCYQYGLLTYVEKEYLESSENQYEPWLHVQVGMRDREVKMRETSGPQGQAMRHAAYPHVAGSAHSVKSLGWPRTITRGGQDGLELVESRELRIEAPPVAERALAVQVPPSV